MNHTPKFLIIFAFLLSTCLVSCTQEINPSPMHAYNGEDEISLINVYAVYYVARGDKPLPDWQDRVQYHLDRIETFHQREFGDQSTLQCTLWNEPVIASATRGGFAQDDVNRFFFESMDEIRNKGKLPSDDQSFSILLVMADMNFCPGFDDWSRECDPDRCICDVTDHVQCNGHVTGDGQDRPGTCCGGSRAIYWPQQHIGLGLVTADGWRVPMTGTDCVVYHEGVGHAIGLPHPEPSNHSVMSIAQYVHNIHHSWVDKDQKLAMAWQEETINQEDLFSTFNVRHEPIKPLANQSVQLIAEVPAKFTISSITAEIQQDLWQPFKPLSDPQCTVSDDMQQCKWELPDLDLGAGLAYRVRVSTDEGQEEIWGYYKIRE